MKEITFQIDINATTKKVWDTLWQDTTFREWANLIDPGTYMVGELIEGNSVQFISAEGYGVTSLVSKLIRSSYVELKHQSDTQDRGLNARDNQWTGGSERYTLHEQNGTTTLIIMFDVPVELVQTMNSSYPKALAKIKELSEN